MNGFANRFFWVLCRRSKHISDPVQMDLTDWAPIRDELIDIIDWAKRQSDVRMVRDAQAQRLWDELYPSLSDDKPGIAGAVLGRAVPQVMRIACLYATLDKSDTVRPNHLRAALALWDYCVASVAYIFGDGSGDPDADKIVEALKAAPDGMSKTQISVEVFGRNKSAKELGCILGDLLTAGTIHRVVDTSTGGRPKEIFRHGRRP